MARRSRPAEPQAPSDDSADDWVCMAVIGAPKGVRGALKITYFSEEPDNVVAYGPLSVGPGERTLTLRLLERLKNNQIVVARLEDEVTVKRFERHGDLVRLLAENPDFPPIEIDTTSETLIIEGVAVGVIRNGRI